MVILHRLEKLTNTKYLNLYWAELENDKTKINYYIASRRKQEDLAINTHKIVSDSVRILPYFFDETGKMKVIIIKEYRYPVGQFLYTLPAGGIEKGEDIDHAVVRELREEVGAKLIKAERFEPVSYISAGLTDEAITPYIAEVELDGKAELEDNEIIETHVIDFDELSDFLDNNEFCMESRLLLRTFYYKTKLELLEKIVAKG